jgi:hypothetical protein
MGPFCKSPDRVLIHILMVGLLSQVMDKAIVNVVIKKTEPVCAQEVKDNVGVLAVLAMHFGNVNKNIEWMCAHEMMSNVNVNNVVLAMLAMIDVNKVEHVGDEINGHMNYVDGYVNNVDVNKEVLAVLAMLDVIREGDIVDTPRLDRTHQEEGEDGKSRKQSWTR